MITSETFYRAECDAEGCSVTLPDQDHHDASHWPRESVEEALREESGAHDETWAVVGERTYCPRHKPGNVDCTACEKSRGYLRVELEGEREPGEPRYSFSQCPVCDGRGYLEAAGEAGR